MSSRAVLVMAMTAFALAGCDGNGRTATPIPESEDDDAPKKKKPVKAPGLVKMGPNDGARTPEKVWEKAKAARGAKGIVDAHGYVAVIDPRARGQMIGMAVGFRAALAPAEEQEGLEKIMAKHGIDPKEVDKVKLDAQKLHELMDKVEDPGQCLGEILAWAQKHSPKQDIESPTGELKDLKIKGDSAIGTGQYTQAGKTESRPVQFVRVRGRWFLGVAERSPQRPPPRRGPRRTE